VNDLALRQFIEMIFLPVLPFIAGGVTTILAFLTILVRTRETVPVNEVINEQQTAPNRSE
jgi:hypothetical protein